MKEETILLSIRKNREYHKQEEDFFYEMFLREDASQIEVFTRWYFQGQDKPWKRKIIPITQKYKIDIKLQQKKRLGYKQI